MNDPTYYSLCGDELHAKVFTRAGPFRKVSSVTIMVKKHLDIVMVVNVTAKASLANVEDWINLILTHINNQKTNVQGIHSDIHPSQEEDWLTPDPW
jgi:hypothetical protein